MLRKLGRRSRGVLKYLCDARLEWLLTCVSCKAEDPEVKGRLRAEAESLAQPIQVEIEPHEMLCLWHWTRYWHERYDEFWYFDTYLLCYLFKSVEEVYVRIEHSIRTTKDTLWSFLLANEPSADSTFLKIAFEDHVRAIAGPKSLKEEAD